MTMIKPGIMAKESQKGLMKKRNHTILVRQRRIIIMLNKSASL
jgi:hypothetical protein